MKTKNRASIKHFYDNDAPNYAHNRWLKNDVSKANYKMTKDALLEALLPRHDDRILEVGCGVGIWTKIVAEQCNHLVAVDLSENMIAEARSYANNMNVEYIQADFVDYKLSGNFDKVFSVRVFEHFDQKEVVLKKIFDALNPQGTLVVITKTVPSIWNGRARINKILGFNRSKGGQTSHEESFWIIRTSPWRLAAMMRAAGFIDVEIYPVILRPPFFRNGENEYPIISPPRDAKLLRHFVNFSKRVRGAPNPVRAFSTLFTESYLIKGTKK